MKDNNIRKVALIAIFLLCLPLAAFAAPNTNADDDSYLAQYMTRYDYVLPQTIIDQIQVYFTPQEADCAHDKNDADRLRRAGREGRKV